MKKIIRVSSSLFTVAVIATLCGCATETHRTVQPHQVASAGTSYTGPKSSLVVGKFDNRSSYLRGLFSDGVDRLGGQAKTILITHLQQTGRFNVMDRDNMEEIAREAALRKQQQNLKGAEFAITGDVTEFGRKEVGDVQLFGIAHREFHFVKTHSPPDAYEPLHRLIGFGHPVHAVEVFSR